MTYFKFFLFLLTKIFFLVWIFLAVFLLHISLVLIDNIFNSFLFTNISINKTLLSKNNLKSVHILFNKKVHFFVTN